MSVVVFDAKVLLIDNEAWSPSQDFKQSENPFSYCLNSMAEREGFEGSRFTQAL
jgi:hypothetical protein